MRGRGRGPARSRETRDPAGGAGVPGVTYVGPTTDSAGRPGVALARHGIRLVVDPDSGALLEQVHTTPPSEAAPDGMTYRETVLEQGPVDVAPVP